MAAYILSLFQFADIDDFALLYSIGCILFRGNVVSTYILTLHVFCWSISTKRDVSYLALLMILLVALFRIFITNNNVRCGADGMRLHYIYQYPLWMLSIAITALCRTQKLWTNGGTESVHMTVELVVFAISVLFVLTELDSMSALRQRSIKCVAVRYMLAAFKRAGTAVLFLLISHYLKYVAQTTRYPVLAEVIVEVEYLSLFKGLACVYCIWCTLGKMLFDTEVTMECQDTMYLLSPRKVEHRPIVIGSSEVFEMKIVHSKEHYCDYTKKTYKP